MPVANHTDQLFGKESVALHGFARSLFAHRNEICTPMGACNQRAASPIHCGLWSQLRFPIMGSQGGGGGEVLQVPENAEIHKFNYPSIIMEK